MRAGLGPFSINVVSTCILIVLVVYTCDTVSEPPTPSTQRLDPNLDPAVLARIGPRFRADVVVELHDKVEIVPANAQSRGRRAGVEERAHVDIVHKLRERIGHLIVGTTDRWCRGVLIDGRCDTQRKLATTSMRNPFR
jgi:hypothetical protein